MDISKYKVLVSNTLYEVFKKIDKSGKGVALVCDEEDCFYGLITDGDARRYLLSGGMMTDKAEMVMNRTPLVLYDNQVKKVDYFQIMQEKLIKVIPVLSQEGKLIDVLSDYDNVQTKRSIDLPVVIMAGGKGTRLKPYTNILPKPLIPVGDKTITEHIMDQFIENGCSKFTFIVNYKKKLIKTFLSYFDRDVLIDFAEEEEFNGTAGGLVLLKGKINETFILTNCDILIEDEYYSYVESHKKEKNLVTVIAVRKDFQLPYGVIKKSENNQIINIEEKPNFSFLTNSGFYIIEPELIDMIPKNKVVHMTDMIEYAITKEYRVGIYEITEDRWNDMGQLDNLDDMRKKYE